MHLGQDAQIKIDTFNYARYGLLHGKVVSVSPDAVARDTPVSNDKENASGAQGPSSEPAGQSLNYVARVSLNRQYAGGR